MNAKEARQKAELILKSKTDGQYQYALQQINKAVESGDFATYIESLSYGAKLSLAQDGYKVEDVQVGHNEYNVKISW